MSQSQPHQKINQMNVRPSQGRRAFTLIELLVVISIIALLISILLPALGRSREAAARVLCLSTQRQMGIAFNIYINECNEWLPLFESPNDAWNGVRPMTTRQPGNPTNYDYMRELFPDKMRVCPDLQGSINSMVGNGWGWRDASLTGLYFGYQMPALSAAQNFGMARFMREACSDVYSPTTANNALKFEYARLTYPTDSIQPGGAYWSYYGKSWNPIGIAPLMSCMLAMDSNSSRRLYASHRPGAGGRAMQMVTSSQSFGSAIQEFNITGTNTLSIDGSAKWIAMESNVRGIRDRSTGRNGASLQGWTADTDNSRSAMFFWGNRSDDIFNTP